MEYPPEWEAQWKVDKAARAEFDARPLPWANYPITRMQAAWALGLGILALLCLSIGVTANAHHVPMTPEMQAYMNTSAAYKWEHPWRPDTSILRQCPPGCPCLCTQFGCIPICGEPTPGPHK